MSSVANAYTLRLERTIRAKRTRVFEAWTTPELLQQWSAPEHMTIPDGHIDLRVGGRWRVVMQERDGTQHIAAGVYREIVPPERLVYTHVWLKEGETLESASARETLLTLELFEEGDGSTRLVLTQERFANAATRDAHVGGWSSCLTLLGKLLEGEPQQEPQERQR